MAVTNYEEAFPEYKEYYLVRASLLADAVTCFYADRYPPMLTGWAIDQMMEKTSQLSRGADLDPLLYEALKARWAVEELMCIDSQIGP